MSTWHQITPTRLRSATNTCYYIDQLSKFNLCDSGQMNILSRLIKQPDQAIAKLVPSGGSPNLKGMKKQALYLIRRDGRDDEHDRDREHGLLAERSSAKMGGEMELEELLEQLKHWNETNHPSHGQDKTGHMVISFPKEVTPDIANGIVRDMAPEIFENEERFGDSWDYYIVHHDDRPNAHSHIVFNRQGDIHGNWLKVSSLGTITFQELRDIQVNIAAEWGVELDACRRFANFESLPAPTNGQVRRELRTGEPAELPPENRYRSIKTAVELGFYAEQIALEAEAAIPLHPKISKLLFLCSDALRNGSDVNDIRARAMEMDISEVEFAELAIVTNEKRDIFVKKFQDLDEQLELISANIGPTEIEYTTSESFTQEFNELERTHAKSLNELTPFMTGSENFGEALRPDPHDRYLSPGYDDDQGDVKSIIDTARQNVFDQGKKFGLEREVMMIRYGDTPVHKALAERWTKDDINLVRTAIRDNINNVTAEANRIAPNKTHFEQAELIVKDLQKQARDIFSEARTRVMDIEERRVGTDDARENAADASSTPNGNSRSVLQNAEVTHQNLASAVENTAVEILQARERSGDEVQLLQPPRDSSHEAAREAQNRNL